MIDYSKYATKEELFRFLKDNKKALIAAKKAETKNADAISVSVPSYMLYDSPTEANKAEEDIKTLLSKDNITAKIVINTTNLMDSHYDVHMKGIWKKSVKEQKETLHLQEHKMAFEYIISDNAKASVKELKWSDLGFAFEGTTEALVFTSNIEKDRNTFMFEQYAKGYVKQHSVGMRYVNLYLCVNSKDSYYKEEKDSWDKYINEVANKKDAEDVGFFWAVTEAKFIEGSAVVRGSNYATPTMSVKTEEPSDDTPKEENNDSRQADTINTSEFKQEFINRIKNLKQ